MAFNGTGTFLRLYNWVTDKTNSVPITASRVDAEMDGMATGLSSCITKDGQTTITANIPFNSFKATGLGVGTARTDAINVGQVQDNQFLYLGTTSGSADAYTLAPSPTITAYATTQQFTVKISATNLTTTPYLQISAIANPTTTAVIKKLSATKTEIAVEANDLLANGIYKFQRNSANDAWIVLNPEFPEFAGYQFKSIQTFTASGTWTKPNGVRAIMVEVQGGGGGGAGVANSGAGSGGAGGYSKKFITTGIGATETVTIGGGGAGGAGGAGTATSGTAGSTSSFGSHCSATGGGGGTTGGGAGGAGGVGLSGTINLTGNPGNGRPSNTSWNGGDIGINGGASIFGGAGIGGRGNTAGGSAAANSGSGGGVSFNIVGYNAAGGAGAAGIVIVHEYV